jgi:hypothetical protein
MKRTNETLRAYIWKIKTRRIVRKKHVKRFICGKGLIEAKMARMPPVDIDNLLAELSD